MKILEKDLTECIEQTQWKKNVIIRTPQFMGSQSKFDWCEQSGNINYDTLLFTLDNIYHKGRILPHKVQFQSLTQFLSYSVL